MTQFTSGTQRRSAGKNDPEPWVFVSTLTGRTARHAHSTHDPDGTWVWAPRPEYGRQVNHDPEPWETGYLDRGSRSRSKERQYWSQSERIVSYFAPRKEFRVLDNPLLDLFRDEWGSEPNAYSTHEWLFQIARHWTMWESERIGSFPLDWRDTMGGRCSREDAVATGEDQTYWDILDVIATEMQTRGAVFETPEERDTLTWTSPTVGGGTIVHAIQDIIVHAARVLDHLDKQCELNGRGIA